MSEIINLDLRAPESGPRILLLLQYYPDTKQFYPGIPYHIIDHQDGLNEELITLNLNYILLAFKKPAASRRQDKQLSEAAYYAIVEETVLGQGAYGSVRAVIGTWKIEHGEAVFKVKANVNKLRLLKTLFVDRQIAHIIRDEKQKQPMTSKQYQLHWHNLRSQLKKNLINEQIAGSYTPHLSTKYPVIETAEGVHLLMRKQPGHDLERVIAYLRSNSTRVSIIQRLLMCLALYESLEREVHAIPATTTGGFIHRDIKSANIMLSSNETVFDIHIIDYGMCTDDSQQKAELCGTPRYLDPQVYHENALPSAANDLFAVAIICTEIWGDTRRDTITIEQFIDENKNIQFTGLFDKMNCPTELKTQLHTLLTVTTRYNTSERLTRTQVINEYTQMLLAAFACISSNIPELNQRIDTLKLQLKNYNSLDSAARTELNKEFVAADYLAQNPQAFTQKANLDGPLRTLWNAYYLNLMKQIKTTELPVNTPAALCNHRANIKKYLAQLLIPLSPQSINQLSNNWSALIELSGLFQRISFLMPQLNGLNMTFEQELDSVFFHWTVAAKTKLKILQHLKHYLHRHLPQELLNDSRLGDLCNATVTIDAMSDHRLRDEWTILLRLLSLYALLVELNYINSSVLVTAFAPANTLAAAYDALYDFYQQHIANQLKQAIDDEEMLVIRSPFFFETDVSRLPVHRLQTETQRIFEENKKQPQEIQRKIYNITVSTICALRASAAAKGHSTAQKKIINSLSLFEQNLLGSTLKQSLFANSTLARL